MSLYTKLDDTTIREIAQQYDIGTIQSWKMLHGGVENTNHLIETNEQKYVLTLCERKTVKESKLLASILEHLEQENYHTSKLIKTTTGKSISIYQTKPVLLKSFIEGRVEDNFENDLIFKLGKKIAKLNQLSPVSRIPHEFSYGLKHFPEIYKGIENPFVDWLKEMARYIAAPIWEYGDILQRTLIHGDIFTSNIVITEGENPVIMDFEEACYYYRLFDIGMAIIGTCVDEGQFNPNKVRHLIEGYHQESPLSQIEIGLLKVFIAYAATATAFWRFRQFNVLVPIDERKENYREMQNLAIQAKNINFNN